MKNNDTENTVVASIVSLYNVNNICFVFGLIAVEEREFGPKVDTLQSIGHQHQAR